MQWISCFKVASNFLFRLSSQGRWPDEHADLVPKLVGSFGRPSEQWIRCRCVTRNGWCSIQYTINVEMPSKISYLLFMFISSPCQNRSRIAKCSLSKSQKLCLEIIVLARLIAECLEIKIVSAVNQICRFASTMKKKFTRKLTVACHRRPTEIWSWWPLRG